MTSWPGSVTLTRPEASLVPLSQDHARDLAEAVTEGQLDQLWYTSVPSADKVSAEIDRRLGLQEKGQMLAFAVLDPSGRAVGMTTYMNIDPINKRLEIGSTWVRTDVQRTGLNTACKRMLLGHAFESLGCIAVELRTHRLNFQSRRAIERLGAQLDGILRSHMVMNGIMRDTAVYSIIAPEWPTIRANLDHMLGKYR